MRFELLSDIRHLETIASGRGVRDRRRLNREHGAGKWRKMKGVATVRLFDGTICEAELHWYEAHGIGKKDIAVNDAIQSHYAVCVCNDDYPASLELRKLYPVLDDAFAAEHGLIRVIDESGEDYLYPNDFFLRVELPASIEQALARIA